MKHENPLLWQASGYRQLTFEHLLNIPHGKTVALLQDGTDNISERAYVVGFKEHYQRTPSGYLKMIRA